MREVVSLLLLITILPLIHGFTGKCAANSLTCGDEGATCTVNATLYFNTSNPTQSVLECLPAGSSCCKQGLYCIAGVCKSNNIGAPCDFKSDCYPGDSVTAPYDCWGKSCKVFGLENDECEVNEDCWVEMTCVDNRCVGFNKDDHCETSNECTFGYYCAPDNTCQEILMWEAIAREQQIPLVLLGHSAIPTKRGANMSIHRAWTSLVSIHKLILVQLD
jgi:hypothetical protein